MGATRRHLHAGQKTLTARNLFGSVGLLGVGGFLLAGYLTNGLMPQPLP